MPEKEFVKTLCAAVEIAGQVERGHLNFDEESILDTMRAREIPAEQYEYVLALTNAFVAYGQDIRAAERKGRRIIPQVGERDLPG